MTRLTPEQRQGFGPSVADDWRGPPARAESRSLIPGWLVAGLAVAGLGALAWYYLGPDLRRYMKIRSMASE